MLRGVGLHKSFGGNVVLNGVDLTIKAGQITALIGPSGSGKTTLLRTLALIEPPDAGTICLNDVSYNYPAPTPTTAQPPMPWPQVTVVFQQLFLWPHLTLRENIMLPARNLNNPNLEADFQQLITQFQMAAFIDRYPNEASIGQRQRVAMARAIMLKPQYILMDEITSALDVQQVSRTLEVVATLKQRGIGVLIITHMLNFARRAADQIIFLQRGRLIEAGGTEILDNPQSPEFKDFLSIVELAS